MKAGFLAAALLQLAAAQPHRQAHHKHMHQKHDVVDYVTDVDVVTAYTNAVVVYVNQDGVPISTSYKHEPTPAAKAPVVAPVAAVATPVAAAPAPKVPAPKVAAPKAPAPAPAPKPAPAPAPKPAPAPAPKPAPKAPSSSSSSLLGISYSPYTASGDCKTAAQVAQDLAQLDYGMIRIYGTDCDQVANVQSALKASGSSMKIFAGIFDLGSVASEVETIVQAMADDWDRIDTINIGNELVNDGLASPAEVVAAVTLGRGLLNAAGYTGNVVTVDTFNAIIANPELCEASDYAAANAYAFFDPDATAEEAGSWAVTTVQQIKSACGGKEVVITESGWPSSGSPNGAAVPSPANQQTAIAALKDSFPSGGLVLFSAYNDLWKTNTAALFWAEHSYGIYGMAPSS